MHIASVFPGFGVGGAQVRFAALANRLGSQCRHSILSLNGDLACREKLDGELDVQFPAAGHRPGRMAGSILNARRILLGARPDLVVTSNWGAIEWAVAARLAGLRHIHTEDGFGPEERSTQIGRRVRMRRLALHFSDVVLPSRTLLDIAAHIWRLPERHLHYIANGIDLARFDRAAPMLLPGGEGPVIGTIAALRPEKNIARLLRALAIVRAVPPVRLLIVGDGPERPALERLAATLGIAGDVTFAGHSAEAPRWLAAMDVFALSSDTEQMPLSLLEAMASGLPCVCTDVGDVSRMLAAANLPYVTACDDAALADGLTRLLAAEPARIGADNRRKAAREYGQEAMFAAYARLFGVALPQLGMPGDRDAA